MGPLGRLRAIIKPTQDANTLLESLRGAAIPVTAADCRSCADPCDEGHDDYPSRLDVDMDSDMLGTVKAHRRQVVISTGKSDWDTKHIEDAKDSLAAHLTQANDNLAHTSSYNASKNGGPSVPGVFAQGAASRLLLLNGSHNTISNDESLDTVIVFPDYKVVSDIPRSLEGAQDLWKSALDPALGRSGTLSEGSNLKSWVLPYSCVIILCSHKRRDKRCAITAPILEKTFILYLERAGWDVHTQLEDLSHTAPLEATLDEGHDEREAVIESQLKALPDDHKALILRSSHIGGHKFAGNCVIYTPRGTSVWYGRVTPHDVESVVTNTIIGGQVLPTLLRGGMNLSCPGRDNIYEW